MGAAKLTEAICEAAQRPSMRFVAIKSEEQQASGLVFRTRDQDQRSIYTIKPDSRRKSGWLVFRVQGL